MAERRDVAFNITLAELTVPNGCPALLLLRRELNKLLGVVPPSLLTCDFNDTGYLLQNCLVMSSVSSLLVCPDQLDFFPVERVEQEVDA